MPSGSEIREMFLRYFEQQGHRRVHSSSLVPANDPTLLYTNAGMNQFKDVFLGLEKRDYARACSSQKCVRAGGKHNDLENVGFTNRHHTFFEMLGNFSFGDYFKQEAIQFAMELITSKQWYGIPKEKLYFTIFKGEQGVPRDDTAYQHWLKVGAPRECVFEMGMKDNFWAMGDTGPCGPCSELHYDMGAAASDLGHADCKFPCDCGRYVEIWNLVFMQFDRDASGKLNPLPAPCVDTGAGLERVAAVLLNLQDPSKISNYDTDLFTPLMKRAAEFVLPEVARLSLSSIEEARHGALRREQGASSRRVIADHARAVTFLISDGVIPSNEGRGYVLRKILRRAIRHGRLVGIDGPFMHEMVYSVRDVMSDAYPELRESADRVAKIVLAEERRFAHTLAVGLKKLEEDLNEVLEDHEEKEGIALLASKGEADTYSAEDIAKAVKIASSKPKYSGARAFRLKDTFGLPRDFIEDACRDRGILFDATEFDEAEAEQRTRARASWKGAAKDSASPIYREIPKTGFGGYTRLESDGSIVLAIVKDGNPVAALQPGEQGEIVLDHTSFYAESGGQVGDVGWLYNDEHNLVLAEVRGCVFPVQGVRTHRVVAKHEIRTGDRVDAVVDAEVRTHTVRNHTATHLLHAALREILGKHVKQAGSLVAPDHLRFDFSHFAAIPDEELADIEDLANQEVLRNRKVEVIEDVPIDVAVNELKAMALFGEKYGERVRVIKIGDFSVELCGGTHTLATGEIGLVKLLDEGSVSAGVRRVNAVTGEGSLAHFRQDHELERSLKKHVPMDWFQPLSEPVRATHERHASRTASGLFDTLIESKDAEIKRLKKELDQARMKSASASVSSIDDKVRVVSGVKVLTHRVDNLERPQMRTLVDNLRQKLGSGVVVLGSAQGEDGKVALIVGVTKDLSGRLPAGKVIAPVAQKVGGSGGGRPDLAEAGGKNPEALDAALAEAYAVVESLLK